MSKEYLTNVKKTMCYIGKINNNNEPIPIASGFFLEIQGIYHLTTAKHVIYNERTNQVEDDHLFVFVNKKDGTLFAQPINSVRENLRVNWNFHENSQIDIAMMPFALNSKEWDIKVIAHNFFAGLSEVNELSDVFFISYQPGIVFQNKIDPIIRKGIVSRINDDKSFYVDGFAFPGNSGSPVFYKHSAISFTDSGIRMGGNPLNGKFLGIVSAYITYKEAAISPQTGRPRIIFEENTGLSIVWSADLIKEIIESTSFVDQISKLHKAKS